MKRMQNETDNYHRRNKLIAQHREICVTYFRAFRPSSTNVGRLASGSTYIWEMYLKDKRADKSDSRDAGHERGRAMVV